VLQDTHTHTHTHNYKDNTKENKQMARNEQHTTVNITALAIK